MSRRPLLILAVLLLPPSSFAAEGAGCDLLFLGEREPLWLQLHLRVNGKNLEALEDEYDRRLLAFYDHDRKGWLDAQQAERAAQGDPLPRLFGPAGAAFRRAEIDSDGDGKVTLAELSRFRRARQRFLRVETPSFPNPYARPLTSALFKALDADKDGKLSRAEVKAAPAVLAELDVDEDECLVPLELLPGLFTTRGSDAKKRDPIRKPSPFMLVPPEQSRAVLRKKLLERYDAAKVDVLFSGRPQREATITLGEDIGDGVASNRKGRVTPAGMVRQARAGRLVLRLGKEELDLATGPDVAFEGWDRDAVRAQFQKADREQSGFVVLGNLNGTAFKHLRRLFSLADRDGDSRLTREELDGYLELRRLAETAVVTLTLENQERGWFDILDADHDGRLSVAELRDAWRRLADVDAEKRGWLSVERSASAHCLTFSRGPASPALAFYLQPRRRPQKGPLWFRKMDRNGDGFVSRREFLGSRAEFDRLDRDGDGLISPSEAEAAGR